VHRKRRVSLYVRTNVSAMTSIFFYSLFYVGLKSFQQLNVQHGKYLLIAPTSLAMALLEVGVVLQIVHQKSWVTAIPLGCGAACGCMLAMLIHGKIINESDRTENAGRISKLRSDRIWAGSAARDDGRGGGAGGSVDRCECCQ